MTNQRLTNLLQLHQESPADSFVLFALAKEYEGLGEDELALHYYIMLTEKDPGYVGCYYHLGKLYEQLEKTEEALAVYQQGMEVARAAGEHHALGELSNAKMNLENEW